MALVKLKTGIYFIFYFHDHSRITEMQGKGEGISLIPHYHFHQLHGHLDMTLARRLLQRAHLCTYLAAEPGTFGFWTQVANH